MKTTLTTAAAAGLLLGGAALAAEFSEVDADQSGLLSLEEVQAVAPDVTADEFSSYDGDANGGLDEDEFAIWEAATGQAQPQ
jgi:hypothetical protein